MLASERAVVKRRVARAGRPSTYRGDNRLPTRGFHPTHDGRRVTQERDPESRGLQPPKPPTEQSACPVLAGAGGHARRHCQP
jgi:hypothetical protein